MKGYPGASILISVGPKWTFRIYREPHRLAILLGWVSVDIFTVNFKTLTCDTLRAMKRATPAPSAFGTFVANVGEWHLATFGPNVPNKAIARKLLEESAEFMVDRTADEAADVLIVLAAWAHRNGIDLMGAAQSKLGRVKARDQAARP